MTSTILTLLPFCLETSMSNNKRLIITLLGCVQGVGFRPFVYRLARQNKLAGHIRNTESGVYIDVQGGISSLKEFQKDLIEKKPPRASIYEMHVQERPLSEGIDFEILSSGESEKTELALLPDTAICSECLEELKNPNNRRYRYPFIHCMTCGPRFSLFLRMPFDRENTTMRDFPMCNECLAEYNNPSDRRFYSQTNCCPSCGPKLQLFDAKKKLIANTNSALEQTIGMLKEGKIVAVKNTGGFLLLVDAANESAVQRLRALKKRPKKPFALLVASLADAKKIAFIDNIAEEVLTSHAAPIVLLKKKDILPSSVAFDSPYYGIMLAHNALQHLLLIALRTPLVATSGNISEMPLCTTEEEAFLHLSAVADAFLVHNRCIMHRVDDSIVQIIGERPMVVRRARGYIPCRIELPKDLASPECIFGAGGHQKNCFAFAKDQCLYVSQHIGNLDSHEANNAYREEVKSWESLLNIDPSSAVGDFHPGYSTTYYLEKRQIPSCFIQHHKAHTYAGMLDNQLSPPFLSISWDGTGLGEDNTIWGGEAFLVTENETKHFATLSPFRLPGSEKAIKEPRRSLLAVMHALFGPATSYMSCFTTEEFAILCSALDKKINAPLCSSMGRLFDAAGALLCSSFINSFEGEAALALETLAGKAKTKSLTYSCSLRKEENKYFIEWQGMIQQMLYDLNHGSLKEDMAFAFHQALAKLIVELGKVSSMKNILLTGGCMQNTLLAELAITSLKGAGFTPYWHSQIPPGDGGLAAGQITGKLWEERHVPCATR